MEYSSEIRGEQLNNSDASLSEAYSKTSLLSSDVKASRGMGSDICSGHRVSGGVFLLLSSQFSSPYCSSGFGFGLVK